MVSNFRIRTEPSYSISVYVAGDLQKARDSLRRQCFEEGLCVTLTPTEFIYTGGMETGVVVGLVNYPRFPKTKDLILERAEQLAQTLVEDLHQWSALIVTPSNTYWYTRKEEDSNIWGTK